ncbi:hypothetical protein ACIP5Y_17245 [Nocardia sp. NPDC088792]|uniref:hypothetical protein n=1 Tax=Nocardia sp. NPDC088792 TaxID=3364332 RepID=UPI0038005BC8
MAPAPVPRPVPEDVRTACLLWYSALGVGIVQIVATMLAQLGQRQQLAQQLFDRMKDQQPGLTLAQAQTWAAIAALVMALLWVVLTGAGAAIVYLMGHGKNWARALLTGLAVFFALGALGTLFGSGSVGGPAAVVAGCAGIVQTVLAAGAVFLCYRKESEAWFRPGPR